MSFMYNITRMRKYFLILLTVFIPLVATAAVRIENPITSDTFSELIGRIIDFLFALGMVAAPIMLIVAGFYFVTAQGRPEKIETGKKIILWTLIGLGIIIGAKGLIEFFHRVVVGEELVPPNN